METHGSSTNLSLKTKENEQRLYSHNLLISTILSMSAVELCLVVMIAVVVSGHFSPLHRYTQPSKISSSPARGAGCGGFGGAGLASLITAHSRIAIAANKYRNKDLRNSNMIKEANLCEFSWDGL